MAGKTVIINYNLCDFKECRDGVCIAMSSCEKKVLKQEGPFEPPFINSGLCSGCNNCISACPSNAIEKAK